MFTVRRFISFDFTSLRHGQVTERACWTPPAHLLGSNTTRAGVLLSAAAYELVFEAVRLAKGSGFPALGFFTGAFTFFFADLLLWLVIALVCAVASAAGYARLGDVSRSGLSVVQAFAGGAILMMLANTMIPEAYEHAGKLAGVFTVFGFAVSVSIIVLEHAT